MLKTISSLADVLRYQGKYEASEEMSRRALDGWEKALGKEHGKTLTSVNNLAFVLEYHNKDETAEEMNQRALDGFDDLILSGCMLARLPMDSFCSLQLWSRSCSRGVCLARQSPSNG